MIQAYAFLWRCQTCRARGIVQNFDAIPPLINHALSEVMRCSAAEHPVLVTEAAWNSPANRERMAEIMFEEFQVPAFYIANTGVLNASVPPPAPAPRDVDPVYVTDSPLERVRHSLLTLVTQQPASPL